MKVQTQWDLTPLFMNDNDPEMIKERKEIEERIDKFAETWRPQVHELKSPSMLRKALDEYEKLFVKEGTGGKEGFYFGLRSQQDQLDPGLKAKTNKIDEQTRKNANKIEFFTLALARMPIEQQKMLTHHPELSVYRHFLECLFAASKHKLTEAEEKILNLVNQTSYGNWVKMTSSLLAKEEREIITKEGKLKKNFSELTSEISNTHKETRDNAAEALNEILKEKRDMAEAEINSVLEYRKVTDELRNYERPDQGRHTADDIESDIVDALIAAVEDRFSLAHEYYALKAKLLKREKLQYHERNVPYTTKEENYSFEQACTLTHQTFQSIDPEFGSIFEKFLMKGQVDAFPAKGKRNGAFCAWWSPQLPVYILMNYTNKLTDILTLAHEFGHAINAELSRKQNALMFDTPTSTTEVASTFMEDFVLNELLKEADEETKLGLMMSKLNDDITTIIRQVACYRFEQELHASFRSKGYLSAQEIGECFKKHMTAYMGPAIEQSPGAENWWILWNHIRTYFYVYSYASGLLISKALQEKTVQNPSFIKEVKQFLAAGSSESPRTIFGKMGLDISKKEFWEIGLDKTQRLLEETRALAKKLGKL